MKLEWLTPLRRVSMALDSAAMDGSSDSADPIHVAKALENARRAAEGLLLLQARPGEIAMLPLSVKIPDTREIPAEIAARQPLAADPGLSKQLP